MKTYFVRHGGDLALDDDALEDLCKRHLIAIHFPWLSDDDKKSGKKEDTESLDWEEYGRDGKGALRAMRELANEGGYVCATYRYTKTMFIGRVSEKSRIQINKDYFWKTNKNRIAKLKTLTFEPIKEIPPEKQALLLACQPTHGTFCRWKMIGGRVERLVEGVPEPKLLESLSSPQQEVMCAEWLRQHQHPNLPKLKALLLPVGRTMKDLDILGLADDNKQLIRGQVTFGADEAKKHRLKEYDIRGEGCLIYFCNPNEPISIHRDSEGVWIISLQNVFNEFTSTPQGSEWLRQIHGLL